MERDRTTAKQRRQARRHTPAPGRDLGLLAEEGIRESVLAGARAGHVSVPFPADAATRASTRAVQEVELRDLTPSEVAHTAELTDAMVASVRVLVEGADGRSPHSPTDPPSVWRRAQGLVLAPLTALGRGSRGVCLLVAVALLVAENMAVVAGANVLHHAAAGVVHFIVDQQALTTVLTVVVTGLLRYLTAIGTEVALGSLQRLLGWVGAPPTLARLVKWVAWACVQLFMWKFTVVANGTRFVMERDTVRSVLQGLASLRASQDQRLSPALAMVGYCFRKGWDLLLLPESGSEVRRLAASMAQFVINKALRPRRMLDRVQGVARTGGRSRRRGPPHSRVRHWRP